MRKKEHLGYYQQYLRKLNHYRYDNGRKPVWLDFEVLEEFDYDPQGFNICFASGQHGRVVAQFEHLCSEGFEGNELFLSNEFTHVAMSMADSNGPYLMRLLLSRRPLAIDSVGTGFGFDISIVVLDNTLSLWGIKSFQEGNSNEAAVYGPDKINRRGTSDFIVSIRPCSFVEVVCVSREDLQYGKPKYYPYLPHNQLVVYRCEMVGQVESTLNELVQYSNRKKFTFGRSRFAPVVTSSSKSGSLFENTCPNIFQPPKQVSTDLNKSPTLFSRKVDISNPPPSKPGNFKQQAQQAYQRQRMQQQQTSIDQPSATKISKPHTENPSSVRSKNLGHSSLKNQMSAEWSDSYRHRPGPASQQIYDITSRTHSSVKDTLNTQSLPLLFNQLNQSIKQLNCASQAHCRGTSGQVILISHGARYTIDRSMIVKHSQLIANSLREASTQQNEILIKDFNQKPFWTLMKVFERPQLCEQLFGALQPEEAIELIQLLNYLEINSEGVTEDSLFLLEKLTVYCLLPKLNRKVFPRVLLLVVDSQHCDNQIWCTITEYLIAYFKANSKQLLVERQLYDVIASISQEFVVVMVETALSVVKDVDHMMDLLSVLTSIGYGTNIVEVLERSSQPFRTDRNFTSRNYQLPRLQPESVYLIENIKKDECATQQLASSTSGGYSEEPPNFILKLSGVQPRSTKWLVVSEQFTCLDRNWRLYIQCVDGILSAFVGYMGVAGKGNFYAHFTSLGVTFQCRFSNHNQASCSLFYSFCEGQKEVIGCQLIRAYHFTELSLELAVYFKAAAIHSYSLHHLSLRWKDIMKYSVTDGEETITRRVSTDMGKRRSCVLLEGKLLEQTEELIVQRQFENWEKDWKLPNTLYSQVYRISEHNLFALFNSDCLQISDESLLLLYLSVYFLVGERLSLPIAALRMHLIPLKKLLEVGLHHPVLKKNELFLSMLRQELQSRLRQRQPTSSKRNRKKSRALKQQEITEQLMEWLKSDHLGALKKLGVAANTDYNRTIRQPTNVTNGQFDEQKREGCCLF